MIKMLMIIIISIVLFSCRDNFFGSYQVQRSMTPAFMRKQIFTNAPTADLQNRSIYRESDLVPELRQYKDVLIKPETKPGPYGDDSYGAGFEAGCGNFVSAIGTGPMRLIKPVVNSERLLSDQWYLRGYEDAASWCTFNLDWETH